MQEYKEIKSDISLGIEEIYALEDFEERSNADLLFFLAVKRVFDLVTSILALIILSPIILILSLIVKLTSPGPIIFRQERVGLNGKRFDIFKFRSMIVDAEKDGPQWADKNDNRVTKVGRILRKTRLDELPQLVNIIKGEMSLVGPRPEREYFYKQFERYIPDFRDRVMVKPGLTGWAQVNGGYDIGPAKKLKYDKEYIKSRSIKLDLLILFRTISIVFSRKGAR